MDVLQLTFISLSLLVSSGVVYDADTVTQYQYDPRGRLIQVSDSSAREINYTYDEAGNRVTVADETAGAPVITSFTGPMSVSTAGASVTLSWTSTGTRFCELISPEVGDTLNLPVNGSKSIGIYQDTGVTLKCYNGTQYDSAGKLIRFSGGGSKN